MIAAAAHSSPGVIMIDPTPRFELSPYLYMQFMEPLGTTDSSVEAAWDHLHDDWREDVVAATQRLSPTLLRYGGCLSSYYRWREAVGPRNHREPMHNLLWGGIESNQVGTHEFVDFCRRVGAEPLYCVNFESDGRKPWSHHPKDGVRSAGPAEAAAWVDYCNNPSNRLRRRHGSPEPYDLKLWQVGNETSYDPHGYDCSTAARRTLAFAKAMRRVDPSIKLIGWGDSGWARTMLEQTGGQLDYLAFHHMFNPGDGKPDSPLRDLAYRHDPQRTWDHLMAAWELCEAKIVAMREQIRGYDIPLALTECHFVLPGRNRCEVLSSWAAGVANARILNLHERHGDVLKIATAADFCGTRWNVNAVMIPTPADPAGNPAFLMPVAEVMSLYRRHSGKQALAVCSAPKDLDITASGTGRRIFLHVVNTHRTRSVTASFAVDGRSIARGEKFQIAADPQYELIRASGTLTPVRSALPADLTCTFPAASVSAVELHLNPANGK